MLRPLLNSYIFPMKFSFTNNFKSRETVISIYKDIDISDNKYNYKFFQSCVKSNVSRETLDFTHKLNIKTNNIKLYIIVYFNVFGI